MGRNEINVHVYQKTENFILFAISVEIGQTDA